VILDVPSDLRGVGSPASRRRGVGLAFALAAVAVTLASSGPADAATRRATDREAGVRFVLDGRQLTVRVLSSAPRRVRRALAAARIRAACTRYTPVVTVTDVRRWPATPRRERYRFGRDISRRAAWCLIEHRRGGDIAFASFTR
jgi:hypothetical protein